jgi:amino acid adenylation domain-containing protein
LIGVFLNNLVLRADLSGEPTFLGLLRRMRETVLGAYDHQDLPFEMLVAALQPERDPSRSPLFQIYFNMHPPERPGLALSGLRIEDFELDAFQSTFDLMAYLLKQDGSVRLRFEYSTSLFDAATIKRMVRHFQTLLEGIVVEPEAPISRLPMLTATERHQLLVEWNDTQADYPRDKCIQELFEAQAARTPNATAVVLEKEPLTYRELDCRANQLAHYLQALGVAPETLVGIYVERSLEMVVGILGILKAGGAYVPLDTANPSERLAFMLEDTQAAVLLTQQGLLDALPAQAPKTVCLDADWEVIAQHSAEKPIRPVKADNLAYVIYTSGSTGKPKGVMVAQAGVGNVIKEQIRTFGVGLGSHILQFSSPSYDASLFEIIMAFGSGATLYLPNRDILLSGEALVRFLRDENVTVVTLTPTVLAAMPYEQLPSLQVLTVAGEACPAELVAQWASGRQFFNLYGPTEATIWTTGMECVDGTQKPPIGRPIPNTQVYILDHHLQPVPVGVPGELHIGGVGLARGYLNQPALTAEKFIPNPFSPEQGARLYRTGDLARYLPDGNIEFLGRVDHQVKVRGLRIEFGEIEAVVGQFPGIRDTAVVVKEDVTREKRLVTYLVVNQESKPSIRELRSFLTSKLPEFMVPSVFVELDELPLTPNGKVDRRVLPDPDWSSRELEQILVAPRTPVEEVLAGIWSQVLGVEQVGIHDDFFDLGGHSLRATQITYRIRDSLRIEVPLHILFDLPTVAGMAAFIEEQQSQRIPYEELDQHLAEVENLSDEEVERLLNKESARMSGSPE